MMNPKHFIVATCFDKRGRIISQRTNSRFKTHPIQAKYANLVGEPKKILLHAEIHALLAAGDRQVHRIHVARFTADGTTRLAKPCKICQLAIADWGVKEVTYTEN